MLYKPIIKIICLLIIIGLNWAGLSAVLETFAYFNDAETSSENSLSATTLDFSLNPLNDFFPPSPNEPNQVIREIEILNQGSLNFQYQISVSDLSGGICNKLKLAAISDQGDECVTTSLSGFTCGPFEMDTTSTVWEFTGSSEPFSIGSCQFKLIFSASQIEGSGFSDEEEIGNTIDTHSFSPTISDIVINEFLPNLVGNDCEMESLEGEWIELYNKGENAVDLNGWYLKNAVGSMINISTSTVYGENTEIGSKSWLVVLINGCVLNNDRDAMILYNSEGVFKDAIIYAQTSEGKSFARIPDGSPNWYDPIPTPGQANKLSEEEIKEGLQPEVLEFNLEEIIQQILIFNEEATDTTEEIATSTKETSTSSEETTTTEEVIGENQTEENQEQGGIIEEITEIIDEVIEEIVDEIIPVEETGDEVVSEPEAPVIEDIPIIEEAPADEAPAVEEQPATVPDDSSSNQDGAGESVSDEGSGDGGGDTGGSSEGSGPAEGGGESSGESGTAGDNISE